MSPQPMMRTVYYPHVLDQALFDPSGPRPQFLLDSEAMKVLVAGLEPGQQIPVHPESLAIYHFLEGEGSMTVDDQVFTVHPGVTIITPAGAARGVSANSRLVFLAAKPGA